MLRFLPFHHSTIVELRLDPCGLADNSLSRGPVCCFIVAVEGLRNNETSETQVVVVVCDWM